jgi:hypothetical protein
MTALTSRYRRGEPLTIDAFRRRCGYAESESGANNGYGCAHPLQESRGEGEDGTLHGQCFAWSCPLATALEPETDHDDLVTLNRAFGDPDDTTNTYSDDYWVAPDADDDEGDG